MGKMKALILAGAMIGGASVPAFAADLLPPPPPMEAPVGAPVDDFSGWYLRGDEGIGVQAKTGLRSSFDSGFVVNGLQYNDSHFSNSMILGVGVGYQFNSWLRADVTAEYRGGMKWRGVESYLDAVNCPTSGRCVDLYRGSINSGVFLANGYVDLGTWNSMTPYVGVGVGGAYHKIGAITDTGINTGGFGVSGSTSKWNFAWALMTGVAVQITPNMKLDVGYRYLDMGKVTANGIVCQPVGGVPCGHERHRFSMASHDFRIGLRYMFADTVAAPPPPAPPLVRKY